jgi:hypothetical protein
MAARSVPAFEDGNCRLTILEIVAEQEAFHQRKFLTGFNYHPEKQQPDDWYNGKVLGRHL